MNHNVVHALHEPGMKVLGFFIAYTICVSIPFTYICEIFHFWYGWYGTTIDSMTECQTLWRNRSNRSKQYCSTRILDVLPGYDQVYWLFGRKVSTAAILIDT